MGFYIVHFTRGADNCRELSIRQFNGSPTLNNIHIFITLKIVTNYLLFMTHCSLHIGDVQALGLIWGQHFKVAYFKAQL